VHLPVALCNVIVLSVLSHYTFSSQQNPCEFGVSKFTSDFHFFPGTEQACHSSPVTGLPKNQCECYKRHKATVSSNMSLTQKVFLLFEWDVLSSVRPSVRAV
jgi:hypothetical protein